MATHTPGPWTACRKGECRCGFIWGADGDTHVASAHGPDALGADYYGSDLACDAETQKANIRLIRAAPELLEALEQALDDMRDDLCVCLATKEQMRAAIAKAEGRSE